MDEEKDLLQEVDIQMAETEEIKSKPATVSDAEDTVGFSETFSEVTPTETMEYIIVGEPEEMIIDVDEVFVGGNGVVMPDHTHRTEQIDELDETLNKLGSVAEKVGNEYIYYDQYSGRGGYAEFRQWKDTNPQAENRLGYFVSLVNHNNNECIEICNTSNDVYGVVVSNSGFCGLQHGNYNLLDQESTNRANNTSYAKVCLLGTAMVRVSSSDKWNKIGVGDFVVPDEDGCAKKSDNGIGFKVAMKETAGTGDNGWYKVFISLVPQNDNVARVMKKLEETNKGLGELKLQIGDLDDKVDANISISGRFDDLEDYIKEEVNTQLEIAQKTSDEAKEVTEAAKAAMENMATKYTEAMNEIEMEISKANDALGQINDYDLETIVKYKDNIASFFTSADENEVTIGTVLRTKEDVAMVKQSSRELQNLVCHVDTYSVGNQSPTHGLSFDEAQGALGAFEYIYVPISDHWECSYIYNCTPTIDANEYWFEINLVKYAFKPSASLVGELLTYNDDTKQLTIKDTKVELYVITKVSDGMVELIFESEKEIHFEVNTETSVGKSYVWDNSGENQNEFWWYEGLSVIHSETVPSKDSKYELWYCHNGISDPENLAKYIYEPGTLYKKTGLDDNILWIAVATINDKNSRIMSFVNQTADSISSTITNVAENVSTIQQEVDEINMLVKEGNNLTEINQTAENIRLGAYEAGGGSSELELLLSGLRSTAVGTSSVWVCEILGSTPAGPYYDNEPSWNGSGFVFSGEPSLTYEIGYCCKGEKQNTYYKITNGGYEVYTNGNTAIASLNTRVTDTAAEVESWTQFETELSDTISKRTETSTADASELIAMVLGEFVHKTESVVTPTEEQLNVLSQGIRYIDKPDWDEIDKKFVGQTQNANGVYCIDKSEQCYYELTLDDNGNIIGYSKYELKSSQYASVVQKVEKGKSYIGLVAENDESMGSIVARTINDKSEILIEADKIGINGTAIFRDNLRNDTTTISGDYIKTGVLTSNNYDGPVTYSLYGMTISSKVMSNPPVDPIFTFTGGQTEYFDPEEGFVDVADMNVWYMGMDLPLPAFSDCYCIYENKIYPIQITSYTSKTNHKFYFCEPIDILAGVTLEVYDYKPICWIIDKGGADDVIYYVVANKGESYDLHQFTDSFHYYDYCSELSVGTELEEFTTLSGTYEKNGYIICTTYFDSTPAEVDCVNNGTKFDLNVGTIYSKNFTLDKDGNVSMSGKITATSGYIGDEESGFVIKPYHWRWTWKPTLSKSGKLKKGQYYLPYDGKYYSFALETEVSSESDDVCIEKVEGGNPLCYLRLWSKSETSELELKITQDPPTENVCVDLDEWEFKTFDYYMGSGQHSLEGDNGKGKGSPGVFVSTVGIGMGHGRFWVNNTGSDMQIAGTRFNYITEFTGDKGTDDAYEVTALGIGVSGDPTAISFGRYTDLGNYHYSSMAILPTTTGRNSLIEVWAPMDMNGYTISNNSDSRLKTNIATPNLNALDLLNKVELKSFDWIESGDHVDVGMIAQQLETVLPSLVTTNERTGLKGIAFTELIPYLIKAVQELSEIVNPQASLMSLDEEPISDTHWVDDMTEEEKQHYVELSKPLVFTSGN